MTFEQVRLVKQTFSFVAALPPETVGRVFYTRLFEIAPDLRLRFSRISMYEKSQLLLAILSYVVANLDDVDRLTDELIMLARHHLPGAIDEHRYTSVSRALFWTLEQAFGSNWTPVVKDAWVTCYTLLAKTVIIATRSTTRA